MSTTPEQRIARALQSIEGQIEMLTTRPRMLALSLASAEIRLWNLLHLREVLQGKKKGTENVTAVWRRMVRERWPENVEPPGALGWHLYNMHRQDNTHDEPVNHDAWLKDAQEIVALIRAR